VQRSRGVDSQLFKESVMQEMTLSEVQQVSGGWVQVAFAIGVVGGLALGCAAGYTIGEML
jgi:lactobin A/cerein 7B family class IIb bacteriocin